MHFKGLNDGLKVFDFKTFVTTAGPSPNNNIRAELFLLGCDKAKSGSPCEGCFNYLLWDRDKAEHAVDVTFMANRINEQCHNNKYITIGGGEPTDLAQIDHLIKLCKKLKKFGFHIMIYSWRQYEDMLLNKKCVKLFKYIDMLVDGVYDKSQRLYDDTLQDGLLSSIGSGNQKVVDVKNNISYRMDEIKELTLTKENELIYTLKGDK